MQLSEGLVENGLIGSFQVKLGFDLIEILLAGPGLFGELLAQALWVLIPVSLFHLHYVE